MHVKARQQYTFLVLGSVGPCHSKPTKRSIAEHHPIPAEPDAHQKYTLRLRQLKFGT